MTHLNSCQGSPASLLLLSALLGGCATGPNATPSDPLEPFNRAVFNANDKLDQYVAIPLAKGYEKVTPIPARNIVTNFFGNLGDVGNTINNLLQGKGQDAATSLIRLALNTVLGIGGLIDVATPAGFRKHSQDFGLTLGIWGIPSGPYLVLPLFGPSSFRDGVGLGVNFQFDPVSYAKPAVRNPLYFTSFVNTRTNLLGATELLEQVALEKYSFVRDGYLQQRRNLIDSGKGPRNLPEYDETAPAAPLPAGQPAPPPQQKENAPPATTPGKQPPP